MGAALIDKLRKDISFSVRVLMRHRSLPLLASSRWRSVSGRQRQYFP
jgi:hypothetical protein